MNAILKICIFFIGLLINSSAQSQDMDTLIDVGGHQMHFNIWEGTGTPILFESGGGNDGMIWARLIQDLHPILEAPIITYDRAGYGQSEYNMDLADDKKSLITHGMDDLIVGLEKLGYDKEIYLVAHSYGGLYVTLFAHLFPQRVKGIVMIDASLKDFYTKEYKAHLAKERTEEWLLDIKSKSLPLYYECLANPETIEIMQKISFPPSVSVIDLVAENPPFDKDNNARWQECHKAFVDAAPNRKGIIAYDCNHYLHFDNSAIAINAILNLYCQENEDCTSKKVLEKSLLYNLNNINQYRQGEFDYWHSERDLNNWGYALMNEGKMDEALEVFQLNTVLNPTSYNVWDSFGEALLALDVKWQAIKMYEKSIQLNPDNENGKQLLNQIKN